MERNIRGKANTVPVDVGGTTKYILKVRKKMNAEEKKVMVDLLMFAAVMFMFLGGFFLGDRLRYDRTTTFFSEYIESECECRNELEIVNEQIIYKKTSVVNTSVWPYNIN